MSFDSQVEIIIQNEFKRQSESLELIASENYTSEQVMMANASIFTNKYSEGYPGKRYYGGCQNTDALELLTQQRALELFNLDPTVWGVNVQPLSGSPANFAVYAGLLKPGDTLMGMKLTHGGHLTHGAMTMSGKNLGNSSIFFESRQYSVCTDTCLIDFDNLRQQALEFRPKLIIAGGSAYPRNYNFKKFHEIAMSVSAILMADIAHTAGLVSAGVSESPFEYCDVVTTTTHKSLRGPRGALIFYKLIYKQAIDFSVFPGTQGGAHYNTIAGVCIALKQAQSIEFKEYASKVVSHAKRLAELLIQNNFNVLTGGTDTHMILIELQKPMTGSMFEIVAELCNVSLNKNTTPLDVSALNPMGIRIGTCAVTTRGLIRVEFISEILVDIRNIILMILETTKKNTLLEFKQKLKQQTSLIKNMKQRVIEFCKSELTSVPSLVIN